MKSISKLYLGETIVALACTVTGCTETKRPEHYYLTIRNMSDKTIMIGLSDMYPIDSIVVLWRADEAEYLRPNSDQSYTKTNYEEGISTWYSFFNWEFQGYMSITLVDSNHNSTSRWKVEDYSDVLVRYDLKREDMERLHWRISYPPTEAMKDVHMFPPYETFETNRADVMK